MARVPITRIGKVLFAAVQEELRDRDALELQSDLNAAIETNHAEGVLIDLSVVETIDSFLGRLISEIALGARLLGAETVVIGIRPSVAITLVEMGLQMKGVRTAIDAERGLALLSRIRGNGPSR
jgi:rsbT antagonist protein RsbS